MSLKSRLAFKWSCEEMFNTSPRVYFWTFTLVEVMPAWWVPSTWHRFVTDIIEYSGRFKGIRVFEWHRDHGLHVHALVNKWLPYHELKRIGAHYGFGLQWVRVADLKAPQYLCKYLGKDYAKLYCGGRQWARFGGVDFGTRVRDIRTEGERADYIRARMLELRPHISIFRALTVASGEYDSRMVYDVLKRGLADTVA